MKEKIVTFKIKGDYIELAKLLKNLNLCSSGGTAKSTIRAGEVKVNDRVETQRGKKLIPGTRVEFENCKILLK